MPKRCAGTVWPPTRVTPAAQFNLGYDRYANGRGVLKDDAEAVRWYRLAAEQGYARCPVQPRGHVRQRARASSRIPCLRTCGPTSLAQTGTQARQEVAGQS